MFRNEGGLIFGAREFFVVVDYFAQLKLPLRHFQNETGQRLTEFCQENTLVIENILLQQQRDDSTHGHHQMVHTKIRPIIFFVAKDGEALYSQQKKEWELTVAQIMNSLLPNSNLKKVGKTTRPIRYDLNQIPYDYTEEVTDSRN